MRGVRQWARWFFAPALVALAAAAAAAELSGTKTEAAWDRPPK